MSFIFAVVSRIDIEALSDHLTTLHSWRSYNKKHWKQKSISNGQEYPRRPPFKLPANVPPELLMLGTTGIDGANCITGHLDGMVAKRPVESESKDDSHET